MPPPRSSCSSGRRVRVCASHPHLVRLRHVQVTRPPYFLVMDLLGGESVRRRLRRDYRLDLPTALWVDTPDRRSPGGAAPRRLCSWRREARQHPPRGRWHRHPHRSRLYSSARRERRAGQKAISSARELSRAGAVLPGPPADIRATLFSLGVSLFEMLTGQLPTRRADPPTDISPSLLRSAGRHSPSRRTVAACCCHWSTGCWPANRQIDHGPPGSCSSPVALEIAAMKRSRSA